MKSLLILPLAPAVKARVDVPGSKSYTLRALLIAAMTSGRVRITGALDCDDTESMLRCLNALGIETATGRSSVDVLGDISGTENKPYELDAGLSGATLRFMLALSCVIPGQQTLGGKPALNDRPVGKMVDSLRELGAHIEYLGREGYPPLRVTSSVLRSGKIGLSGEESSQYLSALLMVAPIIRDLDITISGELVSKPYVDMTIATMEHFGVNVKTAGYRSFGVEDKQSYRASDYEVEGDVSSASYFFAIAALTSSTITVGNLNPKSRQADMAFLDVLKRMGSEVTYGRHGITVAGGGVKPLKVDMSGCPDQAQTLAVLAAFASGTTEMTGVKSLRVKETERVKALEKELGKMNVRTGSTTDNLVVHGGDPKPASIDTYDDHRMAMSFAVAGAKLDGMKINDPDVVSKTFPEFWTKLSSVGVKSQPARSNIVLIGMRGTGKTTIARELARKLHVKQLDLDEIMAEKLSLNTPEIIAKHGWGYFRDQETAIAKEISAMDNVLISTGGGIVLRPDNIKALRKNGIVVLLRASVDVMARRLGDSKNRPPLTDKKNLRAEIEQVRLERQRLYEEAADFIIDTDRLKPGPAADEIISRTGKARP